MSTNFWDNPRRWYQFYTLMRGGGAKSKKRKEARYFDITNASSFFIFYRHNIKELYGLIPPPPPPFNFFFSFFFLSVCIFDVKHQEISLHFCKSAIFLIGTQTRTFQVIHYESSSSSMHHHSSTCNTAPYLPLLSKSESCEAVNAIRVVKNQSMKML